MREKILGYMSHKATVLHNRLKPTPSWNLCIGDLEKMPEHSLGYLLFQFYYQHQFHPIAGMEYHDVDHIILGYGTDVKSEVMLQFFLWGNGKRTFFSTLACVSSILILPEVLFRGLHAYKQGKKFEPVWHVDLRNELINTIEEVRSKVLRPKTQTIKTI